jgi:hypothetical protein
LAPVCALNYESVFMYERNQTFPQMP